MFMTAPNKPSSPPATPGFNRHFPSVASHSSPPLRKRNGLYFGVESPPPENIVPTGKGHSFRYARTPSRDSSRPSTASGFVTAESRPQSAAGVHKSDDNDRIDNDGGDVERPKTPRPRVTSEPNFTIVEVVGNEDADESGIEVIRPDNFEEVESEVEARVKSLDTDTGDMTSRFGKLQCSPESDSAEEQRRRRRERRRKRWSAGLCKRSHSQSVGSDTDNDDTEALDAHDVGSSARRLRRRVRGPGDRSSLIFDDTPRDDILEVEEPGDEPGPSGPPSASSDFARFAQALPFWVLQDPMDIDSSSSGASSAA